MDIIAYLIVGVAVAFFVGAWFVGMLFLGVITAAPAAIATEATREVSKKRSRKTLDTHPDTR